MTAVAWGAWTWLWWPVVHGCGGQLQQCHGVLARGCGGWQWRGRSGMVPVNRVFWPVECQIEGILTYTVQYLPDKY